jgi:hypothetical protein
MDDEIHIWCAYDGHQKSWLKTSKTPSRTIIPRENAGRNHIMSHCEAIGVFPPVDKQSTVTEMPESVNQVMEYVNEIPEYAPDLPICLNALARDTSRLEPEM